MDIWIRSQTKKSLIKGKYIGLSPSNLSVLADDIVVGKYETTERCIEILNDIQYKLTRNITNLNGYTKSFIVYEMPEK